MALVRVVGVVRSAKATAAVQTCAASCVVRARFELRTCRVRLKSIRRHLDRGAVSGRSAVQAGMGGKDRFHRGDERGVCLFPSASQSGKGVRLTAQWVLATKDQPHDGPVARMSFFLALVTTFFIADVLWWFSSWRRTKVPWLRLLVSL